MSNRLSECERLFHSVKINKVKYMLWIRNFLPALLKTKQILSDRNLGPINSFHVDFFFVDLCVSGVLFSVFYIHYYD